MTVYLLLGSNRGASSQIFDAAVAALPRFGAQVKRVSPYRLTVPMAATGRRRYLNCAVEAETSLLPRTLLRRLQRLEGDLGRHLHGRRNPPRTLDIDLIFYDRVRMRTRELTLPHPRFASRRFVLAALADLGVTAATCPQIRERAGLCARGLRALPPVAAD